MAQNYISHGAVITLTAPGACTSGSPYRISDFNGVALISAAQGAQVSFQLEGIFEFTLSGVDVGDPIYITGQNALTLTPAENMLYGRAVTESDANDKFYCRLLQSQQETPPNESE
jgi:predicted RecA/RadA family phage recombinase